jgi:hypothetical protein
VSFRICGTVLKRREFQFQYLLFLRSSGDISNLVFNNPVVRLVVLTLLKGAKAWNISFIAEYVNQTIGNAGECFCLGKNSVSMLNNIK